MNDTNVLFFAKDRSLGWSWSKKGGELEKLRTKINNKLLENPSSEGGELGRKRGGVIR